MTAAYFSDAEIVEALLAHQEHGSWNKASAAVGVSASTLQKRAGMAAARGLTTNTKIISRADKLEIALKAAQRDLKSMQREADSADAIRSTIYGLASRTPEPPKWLVKPGKPGSRGVPMTMWSDWHYGEVVRPEEVGGCNVFNAEIAAERIASLVEKTVYLAKHHMGAGDGAYPGIIVCLGGDMITGDIHDELTATNDRTTQQSINDLTDLIAAGLETLADEFGKVFVPCVVGNHGRATHKPRMKGRVYTSHEWNIYCNLERHFRKDPRIKFFIPHESDAYFKVFGHRFLLTHGDSLGVKGGDGIIGAIGPIMRGTLKTGKSEAQIGREFDTIVMGHWHQMLWLPGCIVNGALKGYDEYARLALRAPYSRPSQGLWFVHPEHGITAKWEVFLDNDHKVEDNADWVKWLDTN